MEVCVRFFGCRDVFEDWRQGVGMGLESKETLGFEDVEV